MRLFADLGAVLSALWKILDWLRKALLNLIFFGILVAVLVAIFSRPTEHVPSNSFLVLDPTGILVEDSRSLEATEALLRGMRHGDQINEETRVQDLIDALTVAATDPKIKGLIIEPQRLRGCDTAKLLCLGKALRAFKNSGKPVFSYSPALTQGQYLLASYADQISIAPLGGVLITGFASYPVFFKGLLDKARVNFHVFRIGDYKSAVEPFTRQSMSEEAKAMSQAWLSELWQTYGTEISSNRQIAATDVRNYVENIDTALTRTSGNAARMAMSAKLIDLIQSRDQFEHHVAEKLGIAPEDMHRISWRDYGRAYPGAGKENKEGIGVIRARGAIMPGHQPADKIGSQSMAELFAQARQDKNIAAVVLRLDSPGGSATASEEIYQEIIRTQEAGKPVVVSMGSLAASGAYWIATAANRIVAEPTTLTGSIGIFAAWPTFENTAQDWGITTDGVGTTSLADLGHPLRPLSSQVSTSVQHLLHFGYTTFLERVAQGRNLTTTQVETLAQGRIFSGQQALDRKMIDQLGGLDEAVQVAANLAGLSKAGYKELQRELSPREVLLSNLFSLVSTVVETRTPHLSGLLSTLDHYNQVLASFSDPQHLYARSLESEAYLYGPAVQ